MAQSLSKEGIQVKNQSGLAFPASRGGKGERIG
jgi:hypothetical protein